MWMRCFFFFFFFLHLRTSAILTSALWDQLVAYSTPAVRRIELTAVFSSFHLKIRCLVLCSIFGEQDCPDHFLLVKKGTQMYWYRFAEIKNAHSIFLKTVSYISPFASPYLFIKFRTSSYSLWRWIHRTHLVSSGKGNWVAGTVWEESIYFIILLYPLDFKPCEYITY